MGKIEIGDQVKVCIPYGSYLSYTISKINENGDEFICYDDNGYNVNFFKDVHGEWKIRDISYIHVVKFYK